MQIDRTNYEIWLIDWLDGILDDHQLEQVRLFLHDNPDLKNEFEEIIESGRHAMHGVSTTQGISNSKNKLFRNKEQIKKSPSDLSLSQFEYLCVAYLEKDFSSEQADELREIINNDPERRNVFELIQKTRLVSPFVTFNYKKRLLRRTLAQKVAGVSVIVLSAAAIIAFVVINFISSPRSISIKSVDKAQALVSDTSISQPSNTKVIPVINPVKTLVQTKIQNTLIAAKKDTSGVHLTIPNPAILSPSVLISESIDTSRIRIEKIPVSFSFDLTGEELRSSIVALRSTVVMPDNEDSRPRLGRFIAKVIREKILKEKAHEDTPLKAYEIAEAGVSGLNKLLGWQMALDERKDENGELKSVYFSSRIIKFNAPVKKSNSLP